MMSKDGDDKQAIRSNRLNRVLAEYLRRREAGEYVDIEALCDAHPDLADALRSYASGEGILEAMNQPVDQAEIESDATFAAETVRPGSGQQTDLIPNALFGRYRIVRLLGEGAMGAIYLAEDTTLDRRVAVKIPKFSGREDAEFRKRFTHEAKAAAKLDHPNICRVYDAGDINGTPFITMEYIDGPALSQLVGTGEYKDHRRVAEVVSAMAAGLAQAHAQGILHRDLKPGNVLMKSGNIPCVTDFGLARSVDTTEESRITHEGTILGTPAYMSPEQINSASELLGPATDIYALGAVLYELLTERLPFEGSVMAILAKALHEPPTRLSKYCPQIDPTLEDLCLQMLEKSTDKRPKSMQEVVDRLQQWLQKSSPEAKLANAKAQQTLDRLEGMKAKVLDLIQRGQFAAAIARLEKMLDLKSADAVEYVTWAREQLPKVRKLPKQLKQAIPDLLDTAKQCMQAFDYTQAAQLLQEIPADFRSEDVQTELDKAIRLQDEADLLLTDLKKCVRTKTYLGIEDNLTRFLELKPGNRFAKELHEALNTYSRIPQARRTFRYDKQGKLQPLNQDNFLRNWILWSCFVGLLAFGGVSWGIMIYLKNGDQTLAVKVDDELLKNGEITLTFDGKEHTITGPEFRLTVKPGTYGYEVTQGDTIIRNPDQFTIVKDSKNVLEIGTSSDLQKQPDLNSTQQQERIVSSRSPELSGHTQRTSYLKFLRNEGLPAHVVVPSLKYHGDHPLTVEAWLRLDEDVNEDRRETLLSLAHGKGYNRGEGLYVAIDPSNWQKTVKWPIVASVRHKETDSEYLRSPTSFPFERWTHFAAVLDRQALSLFVNGELVSNSPLKSPFEPSEEPFVIGAITVINENGRTDLSDFFTGAIDEIRLSRVARYSDQFTPQEVFLADSDTIALYHCDDGTDPLLSDSSGNEHHGTIVGATFQSLASDAPTARVSAGRQTQSHGGTESSIKISDDLSADKIIEYEIPRDTFFQPCLAFRPDNRAIFAFMGKTPGSTDRSLQEFPLSAQDKDPKSVDSIRGTDLDVSSDGQMLAEANFEGGVNIWNIADWTLNRKFTSTVTDNMAILAKFSPDQKHVASVNLNGHVSIWDFSTRKIVYECQFENEKEWRTKIGFTPDSQRLLINNLPGSKHFIYTYTFASERLEEHEINSGPGSGNFQVIDNRACLISSYENEQIRLVDLHSWEIRESFGDTKHGSIFSVSPDRKLLATSEEGGGIALFDFRTRKQIGRLDMPHKLIYSVEFSEDGRFLAVLAINRNTEKEGWTACLHVWKLNQTVAQTTRAEQG